LQSLSVIVCLWIYMSLSCKIFEHFALQVGSSNWDHKLRSTPFKDGTTLVPKLADSLSFWRSGSTPSTYWIKYSWSGSTQILYYLKMLDEIQYLETRSRHENKYLLYLYHKESLGETNTSMTLQPNGFTRFSQTYIICFSFITL